MYVIDNLLVQPLLYHMAYTILVAWLKKIIVFVIYYYPTHQ